MKAAASIGLPLHVIVVGEPTWRRVREGRQHGKEVAARYGGAPLHIWQGNVLRNRIRLGLGEEVAATFDNLPSPSDAVTLASWCLLHLFGGMFHAPGLQLLAPMKIPDDAGVAAFNDVHRHSSVWAAINTAILWSRPGRAEWKLAIDMKIKALREGPSLLPPDPVILGHAFGFAAVGRGGRCADDQWVGQVRAIPGGVGTEGRAFVAPDGTMVAVHKIM